MVMVDWLLSSSVRIGREGVGCRYSVAIAARATFA
jgi:hypothetical protein